MMNTIRNLLLTGLLASSFFALSCSEDGPDTSKTIFPDIPESELAFDKWLGRNYVEAYNINYMYRMEHNESDFSKNLVPADLKQSMRLAKIVKHAWLEAYAEVAGVDFVRANAPRILHIIGSASWNKDQTITLGTAEGGLKITLFMANWLDATNIEKMNEYFFKTMHHEFGHILHQTKNYPQEFHTISAEDYRPSGWQNRHTMQDYAKLGFVTAYAGSQGREDITEVTACYITYTDDQWKRVMDAAGDEGRAKLNQKIEIVKRYMQDTWGIDMDRLKEVVHRRMNEVIQMDLLEPSWITETKVISKAALQAAFNRLKAEIIAEWPEMSKNIDNHPQGCHAHNANLIDIFHPEN